MHMLRHSKETLLLVREKHVTDTAASLGADRVATGADRCGKTTSQKPRRPWKFMFHWYLRHGNL